MSFRAHFGGTVMGLCIRVLRWSWKFSLRRTTSIPDFLPNSVNTRDIPHLSIHYGTSLFVAAVFITISVRIYANAPCAMLPIGPTTGKGHGIPDEPSMDCQSVWEVQL